MVSREGALNCFCDQKILEKADDAEFKVRNSNGDYISYPICKTYLEDTSMSSSAVVFTQGAAFLIVVANFLLRTVFIKLVSCVRENSASKQAT